jgi:hypothetical protein
MCKTAGIFYLEIAKLASKFVPERLLTLNGRILSLRKRSELF